MSHARGSRCSDRRFYAFCFSDTVVLANGEGRKPALWLRPEDETPVFTDCAAKIATVPVNSCQKRPYEA
jgi:hypothetical protein